MRIAMIGAGYVGLVSGACFSEFGVDVVCVDTEQSRIDQLNQGVVPIYEPGLDQLVDANRRAGRLTFDTDLTMALAGADAVFLAVGTPTRRGDGHADLTYIYAAVREIAAALTDRTVIVTKSTVPVGTGAEIERIIGEVRPDLTPGADFDVASNPEFLREGSAINDFMRPDRIVVGVDSDHARYVLKELYRPLFLRETPVLFTSRETAEITKYAANAFLATKISFINEIADLCEAVGGDVQDVARGIGLDGRIGQKFLHAGPGFGGSCFPKDIRALAATGDALNVETRIVDAVVEVNTRRKATMASKIIAACGGSVDGLRVAVLGLTFKPNTDDMREAPSLDIIPGLQRAGAEIHAYDPVGMAEARNLIPHVQWAENAYDAVTDAHAVVIITEWNEFRGLGLGRLRDRMAKPVMIDLRNIYRPGEMIAMGFTYVSVGRPGSMVTARD